MDTFGEIINWCKLLGEKFDDNNNNSTLRNTSEGNNYIKKDFAKI